MNGRLGAATRLPDNPVTTCPVTGLSEWDNQPVIRL
tara:strand:- start:2086 stop:2193 length:108 start_codon:yes stop_codon:yes gene_type:complete